MTQGKHFAAGGDHFAALPNKKIHTPKGIARLTVTAATMAAMTGSSLISPFTAFAQTGDGGTQHPAVMSPIAAHAGAASGTGAKTDRIAAEQKLSDEIARQEAEEVAKQQAAYSPKHLAGTDTAQPGSLAQTGDRAGLIGETFVIGGTVLVAAGVFLDRKKRREQM